VADEIHEAVRFVHILAVVFMAAPLYNLIVVGERAKFGKAPVQVDRYMERLIRGNALRCYAFQLTALVTGVLLVVTGDLPLDYVVTNTALFAKLVLLLGLVGLLSVVHFRIQPAIDRLLAQVSGDAIPPELAAKIQPLRVQRKQLASVCLFVLITIIVLALQVWSWFPAWLTIAILALAALFSWRVYKSAVPYGWV